MDIVWGRFQKAYPRKKSFGAMDDDVGKLRQPLMGSDSEEDSQDEERGSLLHPQDKKPQFEDSAAARRKRRRRKEDEDLGEVPKRYALSVEPLKLLRSVGSWMVSLSAFGGLLSPKSSLNSSLPTSLSTQMLTRRHKPLDLEEESERALRVMAVLTLAFCVLLVVVVYQQNV